MNLSVLFKRPWLLVAAALVLLAVLAIILWQLDPVAFQDDAAVTQAHFTVAARLTEAVMATQTKAGNPDQTVETATSLPVHETPLTTPSLVVQTTVSQDKPLSFTPSPTPSCDRAAPGVPMDITVPDDSQFLPGETFTKIWRMQNTGTCTWTGDYAVRFFFGDLMSASEVVYLGREIRPGEQVDIAVDMRAPDESGSYQGNWKLLNPYGQLFGIGPKGDAPFWVRISVIYIATQTPTPTITPTPTATPTSTPTTTPPVESSGEFTLQVGHFIDLDTGTPDPQVGQDLDYLLENSFHVLVPHEEALLGIYDASQPGLESCQASALSKAHIALESLSPGIYLCYRTDAGRFGWLRYMSLNEDGSAGLAFHTWANP